MNWPRFIGKNILGSYDYLSAEQGLNEKNSDERSDIYALGCVLFHCLTGEVVFPDGNPVRKMLRHALEPAALASDFDEQIPPRSGGCCGDDARQVARRSLSKGERCCLGI